MEIIVMCRQFPAARHEYGCPTLATLSFLWLGWDRACASLPVSVTGEELNPFPERNPRYRRI